MNTNKNYFDLIDAYLNGEMTDQEAIEFENQLQKDPLLENEFQWQHDIVNSIRDFRQAELKATLNAVDVGVGGTFTALKIAAGIGVMALLGFGVYYFSGIDGDQGASPAHQNAVVVENEKTDEVIPEPEADVLIEKVNEPIAKVTDEEKSASSIEQRAEKDVKITDRAVHEVISPGIKKPRQPEIKLPEVVEDFDKGEGQISENIKVPENKLNKVTETCRFVHLC